MRLSEAGHDALYDVVEAWLDKHLPPEQASELKESDGTIGELVDGVRELMRCEVALQLTDGPLVKPMGG